MSQFPVGKATIDLVSDNRDANQKIDQTGKKLDEFKKKGESGGDGFSKGIKSSIGAVTSLIGSITAAIGAATLFYRIGQKIREVFEGSEKAMARTQAAISSLNFQDVDGSLKKLQQEMQDLSTVADAMQNGNIFSRGALWLTGEGRAVEERLAELRKTEDVLRAQADKQQAKREEDEFNQAQAVANAKWDADLKAFFDAEDKKDEQERKRNEFTENEFNERLKRMTDAQEDAHEEEMRRIEEEGEARMEWIRRVADEQNRIRREQEAGFGVGDFNAGAGGNAAAANLFLRARIGRGNGGRN